MRQLVLVSSRKHWPGTRPWASEHWHLVRVCIERFLRHPDVRRINAFTLYTASALATGKFSYGRARASACRCSRRRCTTPRHSGTARAPRSSRPSPISPGSPCHGCSGTKASGSGLRAVEVCFASPPPLHIHIFAYALQRGWIA